MARVESESGRAGRSGTAAEDVVGGAVVLVVEVGIAAEEVVDAARSQGLGGEGIPNQASPRMCVFFLCEPPHHPIAVMGARDAAADTTAAIQNIAQQCFYCTFTDDVMIFSRASSVAVVPVSRSPDSFQSQKRQMEPRDGVKRIM